jgi:hypothetical protein
VSRTSIFDVDTLGHFGFRTHTILRILPKPSPVLETLFVHLEGDLVSLLYLEIFFPRAEEIANLLKLNRILTEVSSE